MGPLLQPRNKIAFEAVAVVAAVDAAGKLVQPLCRPTAIDQHDFADWLTMLRGNYDHGKTLYVLVDNLGVHKTKKVREHCQHLDVVLIFNGAYSSAFNPVERLWALGKRSFVRNCLTAENFKDKGRVQEMVVDSLCTASTHTMARHVRRCLHDMREWLEDYNLINRDDKPGQ